MKKIISILLLLCCLSGNAREIRITCVGASITEGARIQNPTENAWPGQLQSLLGRGYKVENYGVGGTTMLSKGDYPYCNTVAYQQALRSNPDIVFIDLGGNDAKAGNRRYYEELEKDARDMIRSFKRLPSKPRVILMLPTPFFVTDKDGIYDPVVREEVVPRLRKAAYTEEVEVLDMHSLLIDRPEWIPDGIHPEERGSGVIAKRLFQQLILPLDASYDIFPLLKAKGIDYVTGDFAGYACADFRMKDGRECKVVKPRTTRSDRPWIWRARFWGHEPQTDIALLERGYHLVYYDQSGLVGNSECIANWTRFYELLHTAGLSSKAVLEGMSRGAMYALNWAAAHPSKVAAVYIDNPLVDCRYFADRPDSELSRDLVKAYNLPDKKAVKNFRGSPTDKAKEIVAGNYPILILCADRDEAVPLETVREFERKITKAGGNVTVMVKEGFGHHPHSFPNPAPIVDFIERTVDKNAFTSEKRYNSYKGLIMTGYQGWFSCPGDGSDRGWYHYRGRDGFKPGSCTVDMWPDVSEYDRLYKTEFDFADGTPAYVMSEYDESTVETHFRWMREYGIDGAFIQRFVSEIKNPRSLRQLNKVWHSAIGAANDNNRAISAMYDLSGMQPGDEQVVLKDIDELESKYHFKDRKENPSYLYHNGKPLVSVWGVGFNDKRRYGFKEAEIIINGLIERGYSIMIGVPTQWRLLTGDTMSDKELHRLIKKCDVVMPWFVGRYNESGFSPFEKLVKDDLDWCRKNKLDYAPLAFPGFSWRNMNSDSKPIDRNKGNFYWKQLASHIANGAEMIYAAMFDEIDEGTALFKCAKKVPVGKSVFLSIDKELESDHYLWLTGQAGNMLRKEVPFTDKQPQRIP